MESRADIQAATFEGSTPLHWACGSGAYEIAMDLLRHRADVAAKDQDQASALHWACGIGDMRLSALLLDSGATLHEVTVHGWTALHVAAKDQDQASALHWA